MTFPACRWRTADVCRSPKLSGGRVTPALCEGCYCRDHDPVAGMPARPEPPPICIHRSEDPAPSFRVVQLGLNPQRTYYECGKGLGTGGLVCHCQGCGPGCSGYAVTPSPSPSPL